MSRTLVIAALFLSTACDTPEDSHSHHTSPRGDSDNTGGDTDVTNGDFDLSGGDHDLACPAAAPGTLTLAETDCPFTACGGNVVGTWSVTNFCITEAELLGGLAQFCSGVDITSYSGSANGCIVLGGGVVTNDVSYELTATAFVPQSCVQYIGGCAGAQSAIQNQYPDATCVDDGNGTGCICTVSDTILDRGAQTYTTSGNTLTLGNGSTYDYCVSGASLAQRQTGQQAAPGLFTYAQ
jgi:hypothetical protein